VTLRAPSVREVVGGVGALALVLGVLASFAPDVLPASVTDAAAVLERAVDPWVVVLGLSVTVFLYALYRFWRVDVGSVERLVDADDDGDSAPDLDDVSFDGDRAGRSFDYALARTVAQLEADPNADAWEADRVREALESAVVAVRSGDDQSPSAVSDAVEAGTWTDDRVAAAFLGGRDAPGVSLWRRVYAWLYPARAFRRRVERVVDAVERQADADLGAVATDGRRSATADDGGSATADDGGSATADDDESPTADDAVAAGEDGRGATGSPGVGS